MYAVDAGDLPDHGDRLRAQRGALLGDPVGRDAAARRSGSGSAARGGPSSAVTAKPPLPKRSRNRPVPYAMRSSVHAKTIVLLS